MSPRPFIAIAAALICAVCSLTAGAAGAELSGQVAYSRFVDGYWQIWVYDVVEDRHHPVTTSPNDKRSPTWAPGNSLVFRSHNDELRWIEATGRGKESPLRPDTWPATDPAWSPDGRSLVIARLRTDVRDASDLWLLEPKSDGRRVLTRGPGLRIHPTWSPDGRWLAYVLSGGVRGSELHRIALEGSDIEVLRKSPRHIADPAWSPDGTAIAYTADRTGDYELFVHSLENGEERPLTQSPGLDTHPSWSPDGRHLAFSTYRRDRLEIWVMEVDGPGARPLFEIPVEAREPAWR